MSEVFLITTVLKCGVLAYDRQSVMQEQLRQKLIDEPLLEYQEQYNEDPVQPTTREDALALTNLLANSLPLGSIQVGCMHNLLAVVAMLCYV